LREKKKGRGAFAPPSFHEEKVFLL